MSQKGSIVFRVIAAIVLVTVIFGGGAMAFRAGQAQGYAMGISADAGAELTAPDQLKSPVPFYPMMPGYHFHPFMGFFGIIPMLIGLCLVFGLIRFILRGPRHMYHGSWMYGPHSRHHWCGDSPWGEPGAPQTPGQPEGEKK